MKTEQSGKKKRSEFAVKFIGVLKPTDKEERYMVLPVYVQR